MRSTQETSKNLPNKRVNTLTSMAISDYLELIIENNAKADKTPTQTHHTHRQISKAINVCEAKATSATHQIMHN